MQKDFDGWNEHKKYVHAVQINKYYRPRDIWWCVLGVNIGFEEDGGGKYNERPVLILKALSRHVCIVVPLTTSQKINPYHVSLGMVKDKKAFAIISQIRLIDTKRLTDMVGMLDEVTFMEVRKTVRDFF